MSINNPVTNELLQSGYRYAFSLVHNNTRAEDLLQEACMKIARNNGPWQKAYLFTTIRHTMIDQWRKERNAPPTMPIMEHDDHPTDTDLDFIASHEELDKALAELRTEEREVIYLWAMESYSATEISQLIDKPRGTVLSLIYRGKQRLRELLEKNKELLR